MNNAELRKENKGLVTLAGKLRMQLILKGMEPPKEVRVEVPVQKYFCEHKGMSTKAENQQVLLEKKLKTYKQVIHNFRAIMAEVVDRPGWHRPTTMGKVEMVGCAYCEAPPVRWEDVAKKYPHNESCPWMSMERKALTDAERSLGS